MAKVLYFEGAGMDFYGEAEKQSDVGNFRIRTSFLNDDGVQYYIELGRCSRYDTSKKKPKIITEFALRIDHLFKVEDRTKEELSHGAYEIKTDWQGIRELDYSKAAITKWINENLNCSFDTIEVLNDFYGYRVHGGREIYNLMEDIELNHERVAARIEAYNKIDLTYRTVLNEKYSVIGMNEMDGESITIRCHASERALQEANLPRIQTIAVAYA